MARLLFSGLAGVGGVLLIAVLPFLLGTQPELDTQLHDLFDMTQSPQNLLVAAAFGLAPGQLLKGLGRLTDKYKDDLRSTEASENGSQATDRSNMNRPVGAG